MSQLVPEHVGDNTMSDKVALHMLESALVTDVHVGDRAVSTSMTRR